MRAPLYCFLRVPEPGQGILLGGGNAFQGGGCTGLFFRPHNVKGCRGPDFSLESGLSPKAASDKGPDKDRPRVDELDQVAKQPAAQQL